MASGVRVRLHLSGVKAVLNDDGVIADCMRRANAIASAADAQMPEGGYTSAKHHAVREGTTSRGNRGAFVITATNEAKAMQAKHNTLTNALDAGRG
jgi:hypothetical protein